MDARVSLELPFNMSKECTLMKVVKARENDVTLISEDGERWLFERNLGVRSGLESSRCTRTIWWSGCWVYIRLGHGEHIYEEGKGTGASPRIRICSHKINTSKNIYHMHVKEPNLLILLRWRVENNLNMEDEWERSAACTGELLWGKGVTASIWTPIWTWILHARAMCTQCTVPRRVQDEYELDWGKQHTNKTNKDRGGQVESWPRNAKSRTWRGWSMWGPGIQSP